MFYLSSFPAPLGMRCACLFAIFSLSASLDKRCSMSLSYCAPLGMIYVLADLQSFLFLPLWTGDVLSLLILTASGCIMNLLIRVFLLLSQYMFYLSSFTAPSRHEAFLLICNIFSYSFFKSEWDMYLLPSQSLQGKFYCPYRHMIIWTSPLLPL